MAKKQTRNRTGIYHYALFIILTAAVGVSSGWDFQFGSKSNTVTLDLKTINAIFPRAGNWVETSDNIFLVLSGNDTTGTGIFVTENKGYG